MVLDCGCGGGANIKTLLKLCPKGKVQGIDYSSVSVEKARTRTTSSGYIIRVGISVLVNLCILLQMNSRGRKPGEYPSAGPLAHLIDIWKCKPKKFFFELLQNSII